MEVKMKEPVKSSELIIEGKTKRVWGVNGDLHRVILESKDDITKNDRPDQTEVMDSKAVYATATTCSVFQLLKDAGIPVAYERQLSQTEFLAKRCEMIFLEVIGRRYAVGSFLKRSPNLEVKKGEIPHRFHSWKFELFLKTSKGKVLDKLGESLGRTPWDVLAEEGINVRVDDPFISSPYGRVWDLHHPKIPLWDKENSYMGKSIEPNSILPKGVKVEEIEAMLRRVVLVLEGAFSQLGIRFIDIKIEFGLTLRGELVVSDVIDNDSWRVKDSNWQELSKQLFRDNFDMKFIQEKYALMAKLVQSFRIPKQAIVLWRGSANDDFPETPNIPGVKRLEITLSGHKSPRKCLDRLEQILAEYPEGGVILSIVGMSNGLGPTLAARTSWPVIAVPVTAIDRPHDVWSSLEAPSKVPLLTVVYPKNAVLAALNIFAQKNPAAYMIRQLEIEKLDD